MTAKISIITVTYNAEKVLEKTIQSVIKQRYNNLEYIIIDGKSCDGTQSIIDKYRKYINIYVSEKDNGIYDAMNKGISYATGEYVYFLNAGDVLKDNILNKVSQEMNSRYIKFIYGNVYWMGKNIVYDGQFDQKKIVIKNICHQSIFYDRRIFDIHGCYDTKYNVVADYILNLHCFADKEIKKEYVDLIISDYDAGFSASVKDRSFTRVEKYKLIYLLFGGKMVGVSLLSAIKKRIIGNT